MALSPTCKTNCKGKWPKMKVKVTLSITGEKETLLEGEANVFDGGVIFWDRC